MSKTDATSRIPESPCFFRKKHRSCILNLSVKNDGYTLYTVLLILTISSILFSVSLYQIQSVRIQSLSEKKRLQARMLAESGISRAEFFLNGGHGHSMNWVTDRFEENIDNIGKINISVEKFGLFSRLHSRGEHKNTVCSISGLISRGVPEVLEPSLTLTGHVGGLVLAENSIINNYIVLHHGTVFQNARGNPFRDYQNRLILRESPSLPFDIVSVLKLFERLSGGMSDSKISVNHSKTEDDNSTLKTDDVVIQGNYELTSGQISNSKIVVHGTLIIKSSVKVHNSELFASRIVIQNGTTEKCLFYSENGIQIDNGYHDSQFFACDSIKIGSKARTGLMNVFFALRDAHNDSTVCGGLFVEQGSKLKGTMISMLAPAAKTKATTPSILLGEGGCITGVIITDHDMDMKNVSIEGHVWARSIVTRYENKSYKNYLFKTSIRQSEKTLAFPLIGNSPVKVCYSETNSEYH